MPDIMKFIRGEGTDETDPEGNLLGIEDWSEAAARQIAAEQDIELTAQHWAVVRFLREHYKQHGAAPSARVLLDALDEEFEAQGGRRFLYRLFPKGPVTQGCTIGGLPVPEYSVDPSFGTSQ